MRRGAHTAKKKHHETTTGVGLINFILSAVRHKHGWDTMDCLIGLVGPLYEQPRPEGLMKLPYPHRHPATGVSFVGDEGGIFLP